MAASCEVRALTTYFTPGRRIVLLPNAHELCPSGLYKHVFLQQLPSNDCRLRVTITESLVVSLRLLEQNGWLLSLEIAVMLSETVKNVYAHW